MEPTIKGIRNSSHLVQQALAASIQKTFNLMPKKVHLSTLQNHKQGKDFQSAFAKAIFNQFKKNNETIKGLGSAKPVAEAVLENLRADFPDLISEAEANDRGFTFMKLAPSFVLQTTKKVLENGVQVDITEEKQKICVDFSSPNIAKELHVGHIRSTIMGETLCRIFEFLGHDVDRINHVGDWGTQFGMLICHLFDTYPDALENMPDLSDLETFYIGAKKRFKEDEEFKKRSQLMVVELQAGEEKATKAWNVICDISRSFFQKIYQRLDGTNNEFGESYYNPMIPSVIEELEEKGLIKVDDGAKCLFVPKIKQPLIVQKSDGGYGYDTTDLAAARHRLVTLKANRVVILTDQGQGSHFKLIFKAAEMAGWAEPGVHRLDHMGFGLINKADGSKMSTSQGGNAKLADLLNEARDRAAAQIKERLSGDDDNAKTKLSEEDVARVAEVLGVSAVKYYDMRQVRTQNYKFDYDKILNPKGDTAVYLLYSYARICSMIRKSGLTPEQLKDTSQLKITHEFEEQLLAHISKFTNAIEMATNDLALNKLTAYLYDLSCLLASGYAKYKILGNEDTHSRILVMEACRLVMLKCFHLLAIEPLEKI